MKRFSIWMVAAIVVLFCQRAQAQEHLTVLGANYNHDPELIDNEQMTRAGVSWVRVTPRFYQYLNGERDPATDEGLQHVIDARKAGFKVIFGFRIDFNDYNERIPTPGSARESEMFNTASRVFARIGQYIDIFTLGNEPNLETEALDMIYQESHGGVPLVVFTQRLLTQVFNKYYDLRPSVKRPDVYGGSIPSLYETKWQQNAAVIGLLQMAQDNDQIKGFDLHLHIRNFGNVDAAFSFARSIMPSKPFIITEFSLHDLYHDHISEKIGINQAGIDFATDYGYDPDWAAYQWYTVVNSNKVTPEEFKAFFYSRSWYLPNYLVTFREKFDANNVTYATYPIYQQSAPQVLTPSSPLWFINPVYMQVSLVKDENGQLGPNPLCEEDYLEWAAYRPLVTATDDPVFAETGVSVYPNPLYGGKLKIDGVTPPYTVDLFDLSGKRVLADTVTGSNEIDVSQLPPSVYILQLTGSSHSERRKVVIGN